jgi:hypothetical protein
MDFGIWFGNEYDLIPSIQLLDLMDTLVALRLG